MARITVGKRLHVRNMGGSTLFNGSTSKIEITKIINYPVITVSFWMKMSNLFTADPRTIANGHTDNLNVGFQFWIMGDINSAVILFAVGNGTTNANAQYHLSNIVGKYYHVVGVYDGSTVKIYIDGVLGSVIGNITGTIAETGLPIAIGYNPSYGYSWFRGKLAEVKIFNSAITAAQVQELYTTGSVSGVTPVGDYPLDDQPPTYIDSIAGNNGTGTDTALSPDVPLRSRSSAPNRISVNAQYIPNPYMDDDAGSGFSSGWDHWTDSGGDTESTIAIDRTDFVTGTGSQKLTMYDPTNAWKLNELNISLSSIFPAGFIRAGRKVRIFVRYKTTPGTYVYIGFLPGGVARKVAESAPTVWTEVTTDVVFAKPVESLKLDFQCKNNGTSLTATLWIDEIRITHIPRTAV